MEVDRLAMLVIVEELDAFSLETRNENFFRTTNTISVTTPLWGKCEDETHTPKSENLESSETPAISKLDNIKKNTSVWGVLYTIGKAL